MRRLDGTKISAGISGIDPDLAAGYKADVDYYGKAAEEKALDPRIVWITNLRKSLGMSRRAMSLAMGRNPMYIANIEKTNKPKPQSLTEFPAGSPGLEPREECGLSKFFNLGANTAKPCT